MIDGTCTRLLLACFLGFSVLVMAQANAPDEVHISYSLQDSHSTVGQPLILRFTIQNRTSNTVTVNLGQDRKGNFDFTVGEPGGRTVRLPRFSRDGISQIGQVSVAPKQTFSEDLILNELWQFTKVGEYTLTARMSAPVTDDEGRTVLKDSGTELHFAVEPRDIASLEQVCAHLLDKIFASKTYSEASEAASELAQVHDPSAVPYIEKALSSGKQVEPILIAGLERIGDEPATRVLIDSLRSGSAETKPLARSALQRIYHENPDPRVRKDIESALSESSGSDSM